MGGSCRHGDGMPTASIAICWQEKHRKIRLYVSHKSPLIWNISHLPHLLFVPPMAIPLPQEGWRLKFVTSNLLAFYLKEYPIFCKNPSFPQTPSDPSSTSLHDKARSKTKSKLEIGILDVAGTSAKIVTYGRKDSAIRNERREKRLRLWYVWNVSRLHRHQNDCCLFLLEATVVSQKKTTLKRYSTTPAKLREHTRNRRLHSIIKSP